MKTTKIILLLAIVAIPLLQSCKKEDYLTNAEQIGKELNDVINTNKIKCVKAQKYYSADTYDYNVSSEYKIEGSFIKVGSERYSLEYLSKYYVGLTYYQENDVVCLFLIFN